MTDIVKVLKDLAAIATLILEATEKARKRDTESNENKEP